MTIDGIKVKKRPRTPLYDCGRQYAERQCPECGGGLILWYSSVKKSFWKCGCGWESTKLRKQKPQTSRTKFSKQVN